MKLLYLIIILITICKSNADICKSCLNEGQKCKESFSGPGNGDTINVYVEEIGPCPSGLICGSEISNKKVDWNELDWVCRSYGKEGEACYNYLPCDIGLVCDSNTICSSSNFTEIGGSCDKDSDCTGSFTKCLKGICEKSTGDDKCTTNDDCAFNKVCDYSLKQCTNILFTGEKCDVNKNFCISGLDCLNTGVCGSPIKKMGDSCTKDVECDSSKGYYCSRVSKVCETYVIPKPTNCSDGIYGNQYCDKYSSCFCGDGKCYQDEPYPTESEYIDLVQCAYDNKCQMIENIGSPKSCVYKNCGKQLCSYKTLTYQDKSQTCKNNYEIDKYCSSNGNNSSNLIVSKTIILSILLILLINILL